MVKTQEKLPEAFEEFDFYHRTDPTIKQTLRELQKRLSALGRAPLSTNFSEVEQYAENRGLKSERGVVMPAYGRLHEAFKWLLKLEEQDAKVDASRELSMSAELPF